MKRRFWMAAAAVAAALLLLTVMMEVRARSELGLARNALAAGAETGALKHYGRSLNWYVPFGAAETAAEELLSLGLRWADEGRARMASLALMRMRSGLWGDRSLYVPRRDLIAQAEPVLARLRAERKLGPDAPASEVRAQAAEYLSLMQAPPRPSTAAGLAASGGFLLWIAAALAFIFKAFSKGGFSWGRSWPYAVLFVAGYAVWLAGLIAA